MDGPIVASGNSNTLSVTDLGDGIYYAVEADSLDWINLGYVLNGLPVIDSSRYVSVEIFGGSVLSVDFINSPPPYSKKYRSFTQDALAQKKAIKKKTIASRFSTQFINATGTAVNGLQVIFYKASRGLTSVVIAVENYEPFTIKSSYDGRVWNFEGASIPHGDTVTICGIGNKAKPVTILGWNWIINGVAQAKQPGFIPGNHQPLLAMPNYANLRDEIYLQNGFGTNGLVIGIPKIDSAKRYGWVRLRKSRDLQQSLVDRSGYHTKTPRGFDKFYNGAPLVKEKTKLPPSKHNNRLFGNLVALKFGITASALGKTPRGLGELIYDDGTVNPFNGKMVKQIALYADTLLMGYYQGLVHKFADSTVFKNLDSTIQKINNAFIGPIDTVSYAVNLVLAGTNRLIDVPFLHANPDVLPEMINPFNVEADILDVPKEYILYQNYPNPFNPTTTFLFDLPQQSIVTLTVYNILGQAVAKSLDKEELEEGTHEIEFDAQQFASGVYFYRIEAESIPEDIDGNAVEGQRFVSVKKMLLVK
ncbi:MAG: T9SS type A sorting domain-containing protein [Bacteroidota bacterium]|nr:T9SS type A sorting domain-containing protein [Bacteroidota bacterium]